MNWLDLVRVIGAGVLLGIVVGRIVVLRPRHLDRLRPRVWLPELKRMSVRRWLVLFSAAFSVAVVSLLFSTVVGWLLQLFEVPAVSPEDYPFVTLERDYPWLVLAVVNILPIFEEWIFRGIIIDEVIRWRGSKFFAVLISAALFSAFHLSNPGTYPGIVLSMFPASLLLSLCYLYTGLGGAILAHDFYNTLLLAIAFLTG